uniref:Poly [ADP-ribose] polymerase n=1 Tax=Diabrotica virgifera virgifera TaxID=50390 RepID=A0A6P7H0L0_DIAVI
MGNLCCCCSTTLYEKVDPETSVISCDNTGFVNSDGDPITSTNDPIFTIETELRRSSSRQSNRTKIDNRRISNVRHPGTSTTVQNENATDLKRPSSSQRIPNRLDGIERQSNIPTKPIPSTTKRDMDTLRITYAGSKQRHTIIQPQQEQERPKEDSSQKNKEDNLSGQKRKISNAESLHHRSHMVLKNFRNLVISQNSTGTKVVQNNNLLNEIYRAYNSRTLTMLIDNQNVYKLDILNQHSNEFRTVKQLFFSTNKKFFKVHNIEKVHNTHLMLQYELKKLEYVKRGINLEEKLLFHGTKKSNIDGICQENFNWRLKGTYFL